MTTLTVQRQGALHTSSHRQALAHSDVSEAPKASANGTVFEDLKQAMILVVDEDSGSVVAVQRNLSAEGYKNVVAVKDVAQAKRIGHEVQPDLVLLDASPWDLDGLEMLSAVRSDRRFTMLPVLMLTAASDPSVKKRALELGATDFLTKPVDANELIPRVRNALLTKSYHDRLTSQTDDLERQVRRRTAELSASRADIVHCLARAAEFRDDETGHHVVRVGRYVGLIARKLGMPESYVDLLELAAQLHDIGKIGIPDEILKKPCKLEPEQFEQMQRHCAIGHHIIQALSPRDLDLLKTHTRLGGNMLQVTSSPLLMLAGKIAQTHHERWDGSGYPLGLDGDDIPIEGRITAVADVFDALSSARSYKKPFPREKCFQILEEGRATHFDPNVLDAFFACREDIVRVQLELMDPAR